MINQAAELLFQYRWHLLVTAFAIYAVQKVIAYKRLSHIKGPWLAAWSNFPQNKAIFTKKAYEFYSDVNKKYGPIARIGPDAIVTSSPEVWLHVNTKPEYKRSDWYFHAARIEYRRDNIFSQTNAELHDQRRKQIAPGYSGRENLELEGDIDRRVQEFLDLIGTKYVSTEARSRAVDMAKKIQYFTMDVISAVAFGEPFGMLIEDRDIGGFIRSSEEGLRIGNAMMALGLSWLAQSPGLGKLLGPKPTDQKGFGAMMRACFDVVGDRVSKPDTGRRDMMASFIRHGVLGDDLKSEVLEQLVAGSDTTAGALRGILLYVLSHPRVQAKLQDEIDEVARSGRIPQVGEGIIPQNLAKTLPYLQAVIREGLRIWPPVLNLLPKDVPKGGDTVTLASGEKVFLPGGTYIGVATLKMHRDKELYGDDADLFRPERWFEEDKEKLAAMTKVNDLTFGHGKWQCLGKTVAQMEINKLLFELFRSFDCALARPSKPWDIGNFFGLFVINDMPIQITARV
ncbi:cytochrome P450 [Cladorrhinum samala]|uniref:Cytochrome P450 n=1 Tax=Cladorrhinum samala TaxID=585594 RepID=A0AAV9HZ31_9PEZI|nr:cytochrome P450 [Cladorrhinum samala]